MNMSADRTRYNELVQAYVRAFNARKLDDIASLLSEDVALSDWNWHVKDKSAVYEAMRGILLDGPALRATLLQTVSEGRRLFADLSLEIGDEHTLSVVDIFTFDEHSLISEIRAFRGAESRVER